MCKQHWFKLLTNARNPFKPQSRKVLFLGAGASKDAGYPLASELYETLKKENEDPAIPTDKRAAWESFNQEWNNIKNEYPDFTDSNDLEYIFTILSLCQKFHKSQFNIQAIEQEKNKNQEYWERASNSLSKASGVNNAKKSFSRCVNFTFGYKNFLMEDDSYSHLKLLLKNQLSPGDTIITTNYDLLAERCLNDLNMWNAHDGYGFSINFSEETLIKVFCDETETYNQTSSKIKILKLHGSMGWLADQDNIVLDTTSYKKIIPEYLKDSNYSPELYDQDNLLILPDFLKAPNNQTMLDIWAQALQAITDANEVHIYGFSLPEYDATIRTLLLPLRKSILDSSKKINVYIKDSDKDCKERWMNFLNISEEKHIIRFKSLKEYCNKAYK